jgi:acyl dehydratase
MLTITLIGPRSSGHRCPGRTQVSAPSRPDPEVRRFTLPVDPVAARRFAYAADDENPLYFDDEAARRAGYERAIAPPMFVCSMFDHAAGPPERDLRADGVAPDAYPSVVRPDAALLGGGQEVEFLAPVHLGDTLEVTRSVVDHYRRPSRQFGELEFVVMESRAVNQDGVPVVHIVDTLVVRQ